MKQCETERPSLLPSSYRMTRLEPLYGALSHDYYLGLSRSISLELANICREMMDLEEIEERPAAKVVPSRRV